MDKAIILDAAGIDRTLMRIAHEIIEKDGSEGSIVLLGIRRGGVPLARQIGENIKKFSGIDAAVGELDITKHRDDLPEGAAVGDGVSVFVDEDIRGRVVVLVDDVLHTGRTVRAAMDALIKRGRPAIVRLAVLVDRGHRELPIRPDFVGKNVPTSKKEMIEVRLPEFDGVKEVAIIGAED
ncbi:MAG: bifunctional pyr operon transcriptional regulator/uracil phosphoribosyltransferase PyrR [Oscillospiraceae bacterium]|nr:bifunctional pyr operon transcriptional regulator/uracil phosphoribosyltransferase PyrR [Oscillospiraceae bacterium]